MTDVLRFKECGTPYQRTTWSRNGKRKWYGDVKIDLEMVQSSVSKVLPILLIFLIHLLVKYREPTKDTQQKKKEDGKDRNTLTKRNE